MESCKGHRTSMCDARQEENNFAVVLLDLSDEKGLLVKIVCLRVSRVRWPRGVMKTRSAPLTSHLGRQTDRGNNRKARLQSQQEESSEQEPLLSDGRDSMEDMEVIQEPFFACSCFHQHVIFVRPCSPSNSIVPFATAITY
jgi:hypothetical protein